MKAISLHSSLRNYILTLPHRSLGKLRSILRAFFQEQTAADLFQLLVTTVQGQKETAQQFLLRMLDARNKVLFAAHEESAEDEYSHQLVNKSFIKALETGLRDENLVTNLRPFFSQPNVTDEEFMRRVNDLAMKQAERRARVGFSSERTKTVRAQAASAEYAEERSKNGQTSTTKPVSTPPKESSSELCAQIGELKSGR